MQRGKDIIANFNGLSIVHHNKPASLIPSHAHDEHHLMIPLQGEFSVELSDRTLTCSPGRMIYIPPQTAHAFRSSKEKGERLICMIDHTEWTRQGADLYDAAILPSSQLCKELLFYMLLNPSSKNTKALINTLVHIIDEVLEGSIHYEFSLDHATVATTRPEILKAISIVKAQFADELSIAALAKKSGLSERNFSRLFRSEVGLSPKQFLTKVRIDKSKGLLTSGLSVTESAYAVGYQSLSQFIQSFRQLTGQIPSEYASSTAPTPHVNVRKPK